METVRERLMMLDGRLPLFDVRLVTALARESLELPRFRTSLVGLYALVALGIAAGGVFGLLSFSVARRTSEIGVRMAVGARSSDVIRLVVYEGMGLALVGAAIGLLGTIGVTRYVSSLLFGVSPTDPTTLAAILALVFCVALVASYVPARRATRTDPTVALRHESGA